MRLLIIVPISVGLDDPFAYPPMGPLMIGAAVREAGHMPEILFAHWEPGMTVARYGKTSDLETYREASSIDFSRYDVLGLNIFSEATHDAARAVLNDLPHDKWIVGGGAFVTSGSQEALEMGIDIGVIDEGEGQILDLLNVFQAYPIRINPAAYPDDLLDRLGNIMGIAYQDRNLNHVMTPHRAYVRDLDELPYPAWDLIRDDLAARETHAHLAPGKVQTTIFASRGCPFSCSYCNREVGGRLFRTHTPQYIIDHLNYLREEYGVSHVRFPDDLFTTNKKWVKDISTRLGSEGFTWVALSRTDTLDDEMAEAMAAGGCKGLFFGIESGSARMLKAMNKKTSPEENAEAMDRCKRFGITSSAYFIFGFPGEDELTINETIEWLEDAQPDRAHYSQFLPIHGTDPFKNPDKYHIRIKPGYRNWHYYVENLDTEFPVEYLPPNPSNEKMMELRRIFEKTFIRLGYRRWKERASVAQPEPV